MTVRSNAPLFLHRALSEFLLCDPFQSNYVFLSSIFSVDIPFNISKRSPWLLASDRTAVTSESRFTFKQCCSLSPFGLCYLIFVIVELNLGESPWCFELDSGTYAELWLGFSARLHPLPARESALPGQALASETSIICAENECHPPSLLRLASICMACKLEESGQNTHLNHRKA